MPKGTPAERAPYALTPTGTKKDPLSWGLNANEYSGARISVSIGVILEYTGCEIAFNSFHNLGLSLLVSVV